MSIVIFDFDDTAFLVCVFLDVSVIINVPLAFASVAPVGVQKLRNFTDVATEFP